MIFEQKIFFNDKGVAINQRIQVDPPAAADAPPVFCASAVLNMPLGHGQMAQSQFEFVIPGATVQEAFTNFAAALEENRKKAELQLRQQVVQQQILSASGAPMPPSLRPH